MKPYAILAAAAAAFFAAPGAASAAASSQVTLDHFSYTLTDLDPNDGITPSISFVSLSGYDPGWVELDYGVNNQSQLIAANRDSGAALHSSVLLPGVSLGGTAGGAVGAGTVSLNAYASTDGAIGQRVEAETTVSSGNVGFELSPNTALTVQADVHFTGQASGNGDTDSASAYGSIAVDGVAGSDSAYARYDADPLSVSGAASGSVDRIAAILGTFRNASTDVFYGDLNLSIDAYAVSAASSPVPVPEPSNLAMYAAALPLLLALRRRARRKTRR